MKVVNIEKDLFDKLDLGNLYREPEERPLKNITRPLWAEDDTKDAYNTTTAVWEIFEPVNE